jgi:hypothetical protein
MKKRKSNIPPVYFSGRTLSGEIYRPNRPNIPPAPPELQNHMGIERIRLNQERYCKSTRIGLGIVAVFSCIVFGFLGIKMSLYCNSSPEVYNSRASK